MFSLEKIMRPIDVRREVRTCVSSMFKYFRANMDIYDIGCGNKPFSKELEELGCRCIGVDIADGFYDSRKIDVIGSAYSVPVDNCSADAVLSIQVIEHLERPGDALLEAHRLLKPNGMMIVSFPFLYPIHAAPEDYMRYTHYYLSSAAKKHGFELLEQHELKGFWYMSGMNAGLYFQSFNRGVFRRSGLVSLMIAVIQWQCLGLHYIEEVLFKLVKRNVDEFRKTWTVNYLFVLRKKDS